MKYIKYLRSYAAITTGLLLGGGTVFLLGVCSSMEICSLLFAGTMVFSVTASGFMALTEDRFGSAQIRKHRRTEEPERKLQIYTLDGEPQWVPSETCDGMVKLRMVVGR